VGILIGLTLAAMAARAIQLQIVRYDWLSEKAAAQVERSQVYRGKRGNIFDAKHRELAVSIDVASIAAYPPAVPADGLKRSAVSLAKALNLNAAEVASRLAADTTFVWIKRHVVPKEVQAVRAMDLPGIDFLTEHSRFYPHRTLAAQVIGFSGVDGNGLEGIEFYYDNQLRGKEVQIRVLRDALGRGFDGESQVFGSDKGNDIVLTIDRTIQFVTEKALEEAVVENGGHSGIAVVMAPSTGAVLAIAQYPFFNPNAFGEYDRDAWRNRAITDPFEPGSTMKIFSAAAALEHGGYTKNSIFYCENGSYRVGGNTVHDTKEHGWLSLQQIVKFSSNIGAVKVGEMIGPEALYRTLLDFGFSRKTGIDCPGETSGSLAHYRSWTKIDAGTIAFGQGISVSALQLTAAVAALANGGLLMKPFIVQAVTDPNGRLLHRYAPQPVRRAVSMQTANAVARMMHTVTTEGGTGTRAALDGFTAGGKTGTAQKIDKETGRYSNRRFVSSFVGFAPVERPSVVILVVVDEPQKHHYGGTVAAPAFKKIAHQTLDYLNIAPGSSSERLMARKVTGAEL
jgi:cell division protein FtsI (penicillin-binding protein 3)